MKFALLIALMAVIFSVTGFGAAKIPDLTGNWTGSIAGYFEGSGYRELETGSINVTINEQNGRLFAGNMTFKLKDGKERVEGFAGALSPDYSKIYITEYASGYDIGTILSENEIELAAIDDSQPALMAIDHLYRVLT